jgi:hypothetical protein
MQYFQRIYEFKKICPNNPDQPMSFDNPGLSSVQVVVKEEEEEKKTQPLIVQTPRKEALMALLVPYSAVSESNAVDGIMEVMDELQDFVSKVHKTCLKQRPTYSYIKKQ